MSLSLPEEIALLTLDEETGRPLGRQGLAAALALAGAAMMELALAGRLDTDRDRLEILSREATGDAVLDRTLAEIGEARDSRGALMLLAREEAGLRPLVMRRLLETGLLREERGRVLLVFPARRYVTPAERPEPRAVRARLRRIVEEEEIPEPREALLLGLARAVALLPVLLPEELLAARRERIALVAGLEALNRSLAETVADLYAARLRAG
ncbi:GOLPH3/VPS74 family protein [Rubritepida flocculans]|uniref:GOLPH3/VPS74 family protein n=1 Tax=Rubritepida flocculans TaxID=182403 RepID=UPI00040B843A|nr:GPP34 family phosphoprotein [Rubritepida flocculans]